MKKYQLLMVSVIFLFLKPAILKAETFSSLNGFCESKPLDCQDVGVTAKIAGDLLYDMHDYQENVEKDKQEIVKILKLNSTSDIKLINTAPSNLDLYSNSDKPTGAYAIIAKKIEQGNGINKAKITYTVAFKGTSGKYNDIITNLKNFGEPVPLPQDENVKVHAGFGIYAASILSNDASKDMVNTIKNIDRNNTDVEIVITGHSLGGAAAQLYAAFLTDQGIPANDMKVITFAAPPPAQAEFGERYKQLMPRIIRVEIRGDLVLDMPRLQNIYNEKKYQYFGDTLLEENMPDDFKKLLEEKKDLETERDNLPWYVINKGMLQAEILNKTREIDVRSLDIHLKGYSHNFPDSEEIAKTTEYKNRLADALLEKRAIISLKAQGIEEPNSDDVLREKTRLALIDRGIVPNYDSQPGSWQQVQLMQNQLTAITQGGSSHIGSAAYFIGRSPNQDRLREEQFAGARIPGIQEKSQYTDGVVLQAPVDIILRWDQSSQSQLLDLDSHLTGPASADENSTIRFHTYFDARGSLENAPFVLLYRDVIPRNGGSGPEQTRINTVQPAGIYRFYVHDFTNKTTIDSTELSNSGANVTIYNSGSLNLPEGQNLGQQLGNTLNVPTDQKGNVWSVFELDSRTGILRPTNLPFGNINAPAQVPSINPSENPIP